MKLNKEKEGFLKSETEYFGMQKAERKAIDRYWGVRRNFERKKEKK